SSASFRGTAAKRRRARNPYSLTCGYGFRALGLRPTPGMTGQGFASTCLARLRRSLVSMPADAPLGIICGGGTVPDAVAHAVVRRGRPIVLFALRGWADATAVRAYSHHWVWLGQFGRICRLARQEGCREMVFVGGLVRPSIWQLRLDWGTLMQMPLIVRSFRGGDNHLLSGVGTLFES